MDNNIFLPIFLKFKSTQECLLTLAKTLCFWCCIFSFKLKLPWFFIWSVSKNWSDPRIETICLSRKWYFCKAIIVCRTFSNQRIKSSKMICLSPLRLSPYHRKIVNKLCIKLFRNKMSEHFDGHLFRGGGKEANSGWWWHWGVGGRFISVSCLLSHVSYLTSPVSSLMSLVSLLLSHVSCLISHVYCLTSPVS